MQLMKILKDSKSAVSEYWFLVGMNYPIAADRKSGSEFEGIHRRSIFRRIRDWRKSQLDP